MVKLFDASKHPGERDWLRYQWETAAPPRRGERVVVPSGIVWRVTSIAYHVLPNVDPKLSQVEIHLFGRSIGTMHL